MRLHPGRPGPHYASMPKMQQLEQDFVEVREDHKTALVRREGREVIAAALFRGAGCSDYTGVSGRGKVQRFRFEEGYGVVRHYRRGGAARLLAEDAYLFHNRAVLELRVLAHLVQSGFPAPEPLGVAWEQQGPLWRGDIATRFVNAEELHYRVESESAENDDLLRRTGGLIRRMHDLGVFHADLQVRNILVHDECIYIIDFDNASMTSSLSALQRARNLLRLRRSMTKCNLPESRWRHLMEGYGDLAVPGWLDQAYSLKGTVSDWARRLSG